MVSALNLIIILCLEAVAAGCFCAGFILGKYTRSNRNEKPIKLDKTDLSNDLLDPISPAEQELIRKQEEEAINHAWRKEED